MEFPILRETQPSSFKYLKMVLWCHLVANMIQYIGMTPAVLKPLRMSYILRFTVILWHCFASSRGLMPHTCTNIGGLTFHTSLKFWGKMLHLAMVFGWLVFVCFLYKFEFPSLAHSSQQLFVFLKRQQMAVWTLIQNNHQCQSTCTAIETTLMEL